MNRSRTHLLLVGGNLIAFALAALVALNLAGVDWRRDKGGPSGPSRDPSVSGKAESPALSRRPSLGRFNLLSTADPFGTSPAAPSRKVKAQTPALEETRLNLRLQGTVVGENATSYAMIVDGRTRSEEIYRVNEYVQGTRIVAIQRDSVVLQGPKGRERLRLSEPMRGRLPGRKILNRTRKKQ